jgi:hypothetical protein
VNRIYYSAFGEDHSEINQFIRDLREFLPADEPSAPVLPSVEDAARVLLPSPEELERLPANEIRIQLNRWAKHLLSTKSSTRLEEYNAFWKRYSEPIYRAWSVSSDPGKNHLFDFEIRRPLARGAFGQVYEATDPNSNLVAIKVLHGNIRDEKEMLQSFRRGVASMQILSQHHVAGVVPYVAAWKYLLVP